MILETQERLKSDRQAGRIDAVMFYLAPLSGVGISYLVCRDAFVDVFADIVFALLLSVVGFTLWRVNAAFVSERVLHRLLFLFSLPVSFMLLGASGTVSVGVLWFLAVVVAALDAGIVLAVSVHIALMVQYSFLILPQEEGFYCFIGRLMLGFVIALLFSLLKKKDELVYLALILAACDGILQLAVNHFDLGLLAQDRLGIGAEFVSVLFLVAVGFFYLNGSQKGKDTGQDVLAQLVSEEFALQKRMEAYSKDLYSHSHRVGDLSALAAKLVGGSALLAQAGGYYHELGRITEEENYIEAGERVGREYGFPEELLAVMRQHSTGYEMPQSIEAAVVMLSDCILSTSDYLAASGKRAVISDERLVQSIFKNRLEKGNLAQAGLSEEQILALREFYIAHTFGGEG